MPFKPYSVFHKIGAVPFILPPRFHHLHYNRASWNESSRTYSSLRNVSGTPSVSHKTKIHGLSSHSYNNRIIRPLYKPRENYFKPLFFNEVEKKKKLWNPWISELCFNLRFAFAVRTGLTHFTIILIINKILIKNILMVSYLYHLRLFSSIILCSASICIIAPS